MRIREAHERWHERMDARWAERERLRERCGGPGRRERPERRQGSLGKRLLAIYILASLLSIVLSGVVLNVMLDRHVPVGLGHELDQQSQWISRHLQFDDQGQPVALHLPPDYGWIYGVTTLDLKYWIVNARGVTVIASDPGTAPLAAPGASFDASASMFDVVDRGVLLHVSTAQFEHGGRPYHIQTAVSERSAELFRHAIVGPLMKNALWVSLVALVLFAIGMHVTLEHMLKPLRGASRAAARIAPRNLEARLSTASMPREMRPLIEAFNSALDRLETGYRVQQEFLAAAAHELKTPLALIRGQVELSESTDRESLLHDIDMMARQVHQLLHLAEVSEVGNFEFEPVEVAIVASEAVAFLQRLAQRGTVHLDLRLPEPAAMAPLRADRGAVFVLVKNLIENAIQHSPRGAVVTIAVNAAGIVVRDEGEGIAPEHLDKLFTRFWRGPGRRDSGAGLGLAICFEIATAHGWSLVARNGEVGAEFVVAVAGA